jgi:hypothetical protein
VYFADEIVLALGKLLRRAGRDDVLYPGTKVCMRSRLAHSISNGCPSSAGWG